MTCHMNLQQTEIDEIDLNFCFDTIILKAIKEMKQDESKVFSFSDLKNWFYEIDRYLWNKTSFFLNNGFQYAEKMLLINNINLLLLNGPKNIKTNSQFKKNIILFGLKNMKESSKPNFPLFILPSIEKIALITSKRDTLKYSNYFISSCTFGRSYWRFNFFNQNDGKMLLISLYSPLLQVMNYCIIKDSYLQVYYKKI